MSQATRRHSISYKPRSKSKESCRHLINEKVKTQQFKIRADSKDCKREAVKIRNIDTKEFL